MATAFPGGPANAAQVVRFAWDRFHHPRYIDPDPLRLVLNAPPEHRELVALISSALALGRVDGILRAASEVCGRLAAIGWGSDLRLGDLEDLFHGFVYRFFDASDIAGLVLGYYRSRGDREDLSSYFRGRDLLSGLSEMTTAIGRGAETRMGILVADPSRSSALKRLNLFLRWMVRRDEIDPGTWPRPTAAQLLMPLDTHVLRLCQALGITRRRTAGLATVREVTAWFALLDAADPVRFDFSFSRLGIHPEGRALWNSLVERALPEL